MFAAKAEAEREFIHERTPIVLATAAANGGRRNAHEPVTSIIRHLGVGRSTPHRSLVTYDEAIAAQGN
ncbi:hypothetical protein ACFC5T_16890 [Streptomyces sp. NPDC055961]|uniref:hypothetical protein n=1 Tax=Streptomyces sp. NPDC055961 TaxID=3345666 RepID=UPI0035DDA75F